MYVCMYMPPGQKNNKMSCDTGSVPHPKGHLKWICLLQKFEFQTEIDAISYFLKQK